VGYNNHYAFDPGFYRVELNPEADLPEGMPFEELLNAHLERQIQQTGIKVLIIDNLTYLRNETEKASDALPLMKLLKALKSKYGLSLLVLAHTPKRDQSKPIGRNDLQGSKMLINFCDSSFAVGESSTDKSVRYLKQIKTRYSEMVYDAENVATCMIEKPHNFLQFTFLGYNTEKDHLNEPRQTAKEHLAGQILKLHSKGHSIRTISTQLGLSHAKVQRTLEKIETANAA
jgi:hypothetical protein